MQNASQNAAEMVARVFSEGGTCYDCHEVIPAEGSSSTYDILPVTLVDQFMTKSDFDHDKHRAGDINCQSCHEAEGSDLASHVLLPGIDTRLSELTGDEIIGCRDCHAGEDAKGDLVASACVSCHGYHDADHAPLMTAGSPGELAFNPSQWGTLSPNDSLR